MRTLWTCAILLSGTLASVLLAGRPNAAPIEPTGEARGSADAALPDGWLPAAPRDEIRPRFAYDATGGPSGKGAFVITHDEREGLHGYVHTTLPVEGGLLTS